MKIKYTPGPWKFEQKFDKSYRINSRSITNICEIGRGLSEKEDAILISLAPKMLEELINCVGLNESLDLDIIPLIEKATGMKIEEVLEEKHKSE
jgi:hypothetical protein